MILNSQDFQIQTISFFTKSESFFFEKNLICEKVTSKSQKMIINHKMSISGLYGNVF